MDGVRRNIPGYSMYSGRSPRHGMAPVKPGKAADDPASKLFDHFCSTNTCQGIVATFHQLCDLLELKPSDYRHFYKKLKAKLTSWKAQSLWTKLDKRASHKEYKKGTACLNTRVLIIGAGPCGLRLAIEVALLGGKAVVIEKRDRFSRNNVLHLWPYLIHDLKALGAKKFFGKFCAGAIDHISIRTLQCILLKVALLLGVEIHLGTSFEGLREPPVDQSEEKIGWRANVLPVDSPVSEYDFDVLIGGDGKRNTLTGFKRKEFRGKLAIAITANFINRHTTAEASVEEISGVAFIFNQKFFKDLNQQTGIDLENIVYYKDETHYFVMTAKKHSLLYKGVLLNDYDDPALLLDRQNVDQEALMLYAREAADVSTNYMLPNLSFAHNHYGQPDVAMFDFTSIFAAENASRVLERNGRKLLVSLVGDSLLEPFWPTGSGCARGFLGCLDVAWMIKRWASGQMTVLQVIAERESIYQLLSQTTPENLSKNMHLYTIDPNTRYPNLNPSFFKPQQVRSLYDGGPDYKDELIIPEEKSNKYEFISDSHFLLKWFQRQLERYRSVVKVQDFTSSWRNGLALCALIHSYHPELVDVYSLQENEVAKNNQLAFEIAEREFGINPIMTGEDMANYAEPDKLTMVSYLSQFYEYFRKERPAKVAKTPDVLSPEDLHSSSQRPRSPTSRLSLFSKISNRIKQRRYQEEQAAREALKENKYEVEGLKPQIKPKGFHWEGLAQKRIKEMTDNDDKASKYADVDMKIQEASKQLEPGNLSNIRAGVRGKNKVSAMAKTLASKFAGEEPPVAPPPVKRSNSKPLITPLPSASVASDSCYFCKERLYLMERLSAEGLFFHRGCLKCDYCRTQLRLGSYTFMRTDDGGAKFFCFQHYGMMRPTRRRPRKRSFQDRTSQENIPVAVDGMESSPDEEEETPPPRPRLPKLSPAHTPNKTSTPTSSLRDRLERGLGLTPERVEYETMSEAEESEFEQTQHNLSASLLSLDFDEDEESDSDDEKKWRRYMERMANRSSEEDDLDFSDGDMSDDGMTWEDCCRLAESMKRKRPPPMLVGKRANTAEEDGSSTEVEEEEEDSDEDEDWETDSETEKESEGEESTGEENSAPRRSDQKLKLSTSFPGAAPPFVDKKPSPSTAEVARNRMNFFALPTEPVRIDPWKLFGPKKEEKIEEVEETKSEEPKEEQEEPAACDDENDEKVIEENDDEKDQHEGVPTIVVEDTEFEEVAAAMKIQMESLNEGDSGSENEQEDKEKESDGDENDSGDTDEESGTVTDNYSSSRESLQSSASEKNPPITTSSSSSGSDNQLVEQYTQVLEEQLSEASPDDNSDDVINEDGDEELTEDGQRSASPSAEDQEPHSHVPASATDEDKRMLPAASYAGDDELLLTATNGLTDQFQTADSTFETGEIVLVPGQCDSTVGTQSPGEVMLQSHQTEEMDFVKAEDETVNCGIVKQSKAPDAKLELEAELFQTPTPSPDDIGKHNILEPKSQNLQEKRNVLRTRDSASPEKTNRLRSRIDQSVWAEHVPIMTNKVETVTTALDSNQGKSLTVCDNHSNGISNDKKAKDDIELQDDKLSNKITNESHCAQESDTNQTGVKDVKEKVEDKDESSKKAPDARLEMEEDLSDPDAVTPDDEMKSMHPKSPEVHSSPFLTPKLLPFPLPRQPRLSSGSVESTSRDETVHKPPSLKRSVSENAAAASVVSSSDKKCSDSLQRQVSLTPPSNRSSRTKSPHVSQSSTGSGNILDSDVKEQIDVDNVFVSEDEASNDTSHNLVEVKMGEDVNSPKLIVDETNVTSRRGGGRRKKHRSAPIGGETSGQDSMTDNDLELADTKKSNGSDSSFTISTPSGSVHSSISSIGTGSRDSLLDVEKKTNQRDSVIYLENADQTLTPTTDLNCSSENSLANTTMDRLVSLNSATGLVEQDCDVTISDIVQVNDDDEVKFRRPESILYKKTLQRDTLQRKLDYRSGSVEKNVPPEKSVPEILSKNEGNITHDLDEAKTDKDNVKESERTMQVSVPHNQGHKKLCDDSSIIDQNCVKNLESAKLVVKDTSDKAVKSDSSHKKLYSTNIDGKSVIESKDLNKALQEQQQQQQQAINNASCKKTIQDTVSELDMTMDNLVAWNTQSNMDSQMDVTLSDILNETDMLSVSSTFNSMDALNPGESDIKETSLDSTLCNEGNVTIESEYGTPNASFADEHSESVIEVDHTTPTVTFRKSPSKEKTLTSNTSTEPSIALKKQQFELDVTPSSSPNRIKDAKWKFLAETPKPVRIDPVSLFDQEAQKELKHSQNSNDDAGKIKRHGLIYDNEQDDKENVPQSETVVTPDDSKTIEEVFFTPATSMKPKSSSSSSNAHDETPFSEFKKPKDARKRLLSNESKTKAEEVRMIREMELEKARADARKRARLKSDEDLGLEGVYMPRKNGSDKQNDIGSGNIKSSSTIPCDKKQLSISSSTSSSDSDKNHSRTVSNASTKSGDSGSREKTLISKPVVDLQPNSSPSTGSERSLSSRSRSESDQSPALKSKGKNSKGKKKAPLEKSQSLKSPDDKEHCKDSDKKEKRKSFLEMLFGGKDKEKEKGKNASSDKEAKEVGSSKEKEKTKSDQKSENLSKVKSPEKKSSTPKIKTPKIKTPKSKDRKKDKKEEKKAAEEIPLAIFTNAKKKGQSSCESPKISFIAKSVSVPMPQIQPDKDSPSTPRQETTRAPKAVIDEDLESDYDDRFSVRSFRSTTSHGSLLNEEDFNDRTLKRAQRAAKRQQKQKEQKRLRMAQELQRKLEEVETKQHEVEGRGVDIEKALRGEGPEGSRPEAELMQEWFNLVHEKNVLVRFESELMVHAKELELQDRQSRLEQALRDKLLVDAGSKSSESEADKKILEELLEVVEQRDALVALIEEDRVREKEEDKDLKAMMMNKGFDISPTKYTGKLKMPNIRDLDSSC